MLLVVDKFLFAGGWTNRRIVFEIFVFSPEVVVVSSESIALSFDHIKVHFISIF